MSDDQATFVVNANRPYDDTHDWVVREVQTSIRRSEVCTRCGRRVSSLLNPFGMKGWVRSYPDHPPCVGLPANEQLAAAGYQTEAMA